MRTAFNPQLKELRLLQLASNKGYLEKFFRFTTDCLPRVLGSFLNCICTALAQAASSLIRFWIRFWCLLNNRSRQHPLAVKAEQTDDKRFLLLVTVSFARR